MGKCPKCGRILNKRQKKYCSSKCQQLGSRKRIYKKCLICEKIFIVPPSINKQKYCSFRCYWVSKKRCIPWNKGVKYSDGQKKNILKYSKIFKKGQKPWNTGKAWDEETKRLMSKNRKGKCTGEANPARRYEIRELSRNQMLKMWQDPIKKKKIVEAISKTNTWFKKGQIPHNKGKTPKPESIEKMRAKAKGRIPSNKLPLPSKNELYNLYIHQMRDSREIAGMYKTNMLTVLHWLDHYQIKKRRSLYGYKKKIRCLAGHKVDSIGERKIADFLFTNNIRYLHNKVINKEKKILKRYDFYLPDFDVYIEYLGLIGKLFYDINLAEKIKIYHNLGVNVIYLKPGENFQKILTPLIKN